MDETNVSVRVALRIRPKIPREIIEMCQVCTNVTPGEPQVTLGSDKAFTYDYVFDTEDLQDTVYETTVSPLVDSALEGYNATILAYGQTGSGKTYSMGSGFDVELTEKQMGIIPRAINQLFDGINMRINNAKQQGLIVPEFKVMVQFMELYNEEVIDLFNPVYNKDIVHKIHEDTSGGIMVKGITMKTVLNAEDALQCLRLGALSRTTASTLMNSQSSRSHAIFTVHLKQQRFIMISEEDDTDTNEFETLTAKFHFVDLAGSERLKRTGATGDRAKEGISINCGLLALGNVISALGDPSRKALHVPYRDSKLTRLLQDSLGGNSQTVMIACVSPSDRDFMETLNTLKYANRARNIKNKISINQDKSSRTISQLRHQVSQLQLELIEYKQGKRIICQDGTEAVNDMFYENNMLQSELNTLRTRTKAMQDTIDVLTTKNTNLLSEKATAGWIGSNNDNHMSELMQSYIKEIQELQAKLIEANNTCEQLKKQLSKALQHTNLHNIDRTEDLPMLIEEARKELQREKNILKHRKSSEYDSDNSDNDSYNTDSENEEKDSTFSLKNELMTLTSDIDMKQKLVDELELSHRRMQSMRQHYEDKLIMLQARINSTQEERDKVLQSYSVNSSQPTDKMKKIKDEYTKKISDMQKELRRLQSAQKEHARLIRSQSQHESQLKSFKNELQDMKRAKVKLINKMKEESQRHKESELRRVREIAQLRKESRKSANTIKAMETERKIKDQVLKRKQEEVSVLRKNQRRQYDRHGKFIVQQQAKQFVEKMAKQKWLKVEKSINNIAISKRGIIEQEVRMEHFLEKREVLGKELDIVECRRRQAMDQYHDIQTLDSYIEDLKENINYAQETISETQRNIMEIEETQDHNDGTDIQEVVDSIGDIDEAKYLLHKLFGMTLSHSHAVAQRDAKLKETDATVAELKQDNLVKGQLLDHVLHADFPIYTAKELTTSLSSNANDTSSTNSSRSGSPVSSQFLTTGGFDRQNSASQSKLKMRRRTAAPAAEMLFGLSGDQNVASNHQVMTKSQDSHLFPDNRQRMTNMTGSLKLNL